MQYWKFDPARKPHVRSELYPKQVDQNYKYFALQRTAQVDGWGVPDNIEGATQWQNGKTYFFKARLRPRR